MQGYQTNSGPTSNLSNDNRKLNLIGHKVLVNSFKIAIPSEKLYKNKVLAWQNYDQNLESKTVDQRKANALAD